MYKYETHVHTSEASRCGKQSGAEVARLYRELGYDGIIITDHFVNGSTRTTPDMSWEEKMDIFTSGYKNAKAEGDDIGLDVFFGMEFNYRHTEVLVYGLSEEWLYSHPDCDKLDMREFCTLARESGAFVVAAHPFRQRPYIKAICLYPDCVDAVEVVNTSHTPDMPFDRRAEWYANEYNLAKTGGSDNHFREQKQIGGIKTEKKIGKISDYGDIVRSGQLEIFKEDNVILASRE